MPSVCLFVWQSSFPTARESFTTHKHKTLRAVDGKKMKNQTERCFFHAARPRYWQTDVLVLAVKVTITC